uniref:Uncharacterized protein LOC104212925 n=1 Tax=Nicotiana sylvestris TaxID=4096 RepID=A0A1U7VE59_NICSY|nr:PREDICTED: uncharacterized protein LOC104212925 [Nicotiana sylvestris]
MCMTLCMVELLIKPKYIRPWPSILCCCLIFFVHTHFYLNKKDINWRTGVYKTKDLIIPFDVKLVEGLPQQVEADCGVFATSFAEYFIEGKTPPKKFNAYAHRRRFGALLWDYARKKMELNVQNDDVIIGRQKKSKKQKK